MNKPTAVVAGALLLHAGAFALMLAGVEPFHTLFYLFAWWSFIAILSAQNHRRGQNSLLFDEPGEFLWIGVISVMVWLLFEALNFRLANWNYVGLPIEVVVRWPGYILSFATVFLGVFETERCLFNWGLFRTRSERVLRVPRGLLIRFMLLGGLMLAAALWSPTLFYPLIWMGFILLLDPVIYLWGDRSASLLAQFHDGEFGRAKRLLLAGLACGVLWEFWNYWSGAKWIYSLPGLGFLPIFEMPVAGYLGFPLFALECYLFYQLADIFRASRYYRLLPWRVVSLLAAVSFAVAVIRGIDEWTVVSFKLLLPH